MHYVTHINVEIIRHLNFSGVSTPYQEKNDTLKQIALNEK